MTGEDAYLRRWTRLNRAAGPGGTKAPHKPVLLLAILDGMDAGEILGNQIFITPELVARFRDRWAQLAGYWTGKPEFALPFWHLQEKREPFWALRMRPGQEVLLTSSHSVKSFKQLREAVWYGYFAPDLAAILYDPTARVRFRQLLLRHYFGVGDMPDPGYTGSGLLAEAEAQVLSDGGLAYGIAPPPDEETAFVRGAAFKRVVPREYGYTCCISGTRVTSTTGAQLIDACHILPFAETGDDSIGNGLALCPNLHRAFDRGLIGVDAEYRVWVSDAFSESPGGYELKPLAGRLIALPREERYWPRVDALLRHRGRNRQLYWLKI